MSRSEGLADVVAAGDYRDSLEALRDHIARSLESVDPDKRAPLAKQLAEVLRELANLPAAKGRSSLDDLAARRRDRGTATAG